MNKIEEFLNKLGVIFRKEESLFKVTYYIKDITIEVSSNCATITSRDGFYTDKINERLLSYLRDILD